MHPLRPPRLPRFRKFSTSNLHLVKADLPKREPCFEREHFKISMVRHERVAELVLHSIHSRPYLFQRACANEKIFKQILLDARDELRKELSRSGNLISLGKYLQTHFGATPFFVSTLVDLLKQNS